MTTAALNTPYSARSGAPTTIAGCTDSLPSAIRPIAATTESRSAVWCRRSSIEYPEIPSSGKITSAALASEACRASASVRSALKTGSPIRTCGTAAATRTNPCLYNEANGCSLDS